MGGRESFVTLRTSQGPIDMPLQARWVNWEGNNEPRLLYKGHGIKHIAQLRRHLCVSVWGWGSWKSRHFFPQHPTPRWPFWWLNCHTYWRSALETLGFFLLRSLSWAHKSYNSLISRIWQPCRQCHWLKPGTHNTISSVLDALTHLHPSQGESLIGDRS